MERTTKRERRLREQNNALTVENWNLRHAEIVDVRFWTGLKEGEGRLGKTWTKATLMGGHTPVVYIRDREGHNVGAVALTHVEVCTDRKS